MYPLKSVILVTLLLLFAGLTNAQPYYIVDTDPWNQNFNDSAMDQVYGPGNWIRTDYTAQAANIFTATTSFVMLEGSDANAIAMSNFLTNNQALIENWVSYGGRLFINAAPNQGGNINCGFDNTTLLYPNYYTSGGAVNPNDSIFNGPYTPVATSYTGNYLGHALISGINLDSLMYGNQPNTLVLAQKSWGLGTVFFGGLTQPNWWSPVAEGENLWYNIFNNFAVQTTPIDSGALDSFVVFANYNCSPLQLTVNTVNYYPGMGVKTYFGDNTTDSSAINAAVLTGGTASISHSYNASGTYTIKQQLYNGPAVIDSLEFSYQYIVCSSVQVSFYHDVNNNCVMDNAEGPITQATLTEVDSNNVPIDTIAATSGFYYTEHGNVGDIYTFRPISITGFYVTCPMAGAYVDTLNVGNGGNINFGVTCLPGNSFDLAINPVTNSYSNTATVMINVTNVYCTPQNAVATMQFSTDYAFLGSTPAPATANGQTLTWNLNNVYNDSPANIVVYLTPSGPNLTIGDTVNYTFTVDPIVGDTDSVNNIVIVEDTIFGAWDPNHISVSPQGYITAGTKLKYSVMFENTGNAPAQNIYVLDTLPDQADLNSLRMITASAPMYTTIFESGGHNIVRFEFPNINLPDSVHYPYNCTGMFSYTINTKPGLAPGTFIDNRAGIYFDNNDVVMTNSVRNIIASPQYVQFVNAADNIKLYPNPATNQLIISADEHVYRSFTITNSMGQLMLQDEVRGTNTTLNIKRLPAGIYYVTLKGTEGNEVRKFVKM
jgi:uncharacterized repeat protein (TIGR01451 family)